MRPVRDRVHVHYPWRFFKSQCPNVIIPMCVCDRQIDRYVYTYVCVPNVYMCNVYMCVPNVYICVCVPNVITPMCVCDRQIDRCVYTYVSVPTSQCPNVTPPIQITRPHVTTRIQITSYSLLGPSTLRNFL